MQKRMQKKIHDHDIAQIVIQSKYNFNVDICCATKIIKQYQKTFREEIYIVFIIYLLSLNIMFILTYEIFQQKVTKCSGEIIFSRVYNWNTLEFEFLIFHNIFIYWYYRIAPPTSKVLQHPHCVDGFHRENLLKMSNNSVHTF